MLSQVFGLLLGAIVCATALPNRNSSFVRIVGGKDANIADYPYQVSILIDDEHACGGSILKSTFILTAAHCFVTESRVSHITIRAGSSARTSGGTIVKTKKLYAHSSFNADTYDYDVAVIELASALTFGTGVRAISLPSASTSFNNGQTSTVTGWGLTTNDGSLASILQVVDVPLITTATCQSGFYGTAITTRMFCAGVEGKDSCVGDSGGPIVTNGILIGIVSWGDICGQAKTPGVYTKVTEVLSYITGIVGT
ncbi:hypothetical protein ABEB36_013201 [Hypothenemus hampei]|uniref:Peptidase S1 domain-containing protein n=1 Tax=Hypothenemus hampei TaxID=57062 RepID=A0ABD1E772_HYPHA